MNFGRKHGRYGIVWVGLFVCACATVPTKNPRALGAVSSTDTKATHVGVTILKAGGNAVDAAVATALALAVVNPQAGNLGGGGFAVIKFGNQVTSLDFREVAPAGSSRNMYLSPDGKPVKGASTIGPLSAGVPGAPKGYFELHRKFGQLTWADVVAPAVKLAQEGLMETDRLANVIAYKAKVFRQFPETAAHWLPGGHLPQRGDVLALDDLAATLSRYATEGPDAIVAGKVARSIQSLSAKYGGIITSSDMQDYRPVWREPVHISAFGWQFAAMNLPSSGGILLAQTFALLEKLQWSTLEDLPARHVLVESWRRAYADRYLLGDPASTLASADDLLAPGWISQRAKSIEMTRAIPSTEIEHWSDQESTETTHLSVVDADGNAVAMTVTLNGPFGGGFYVPGAGFFLNNEMDDFTTAPGHANMFGLIQGEANSVGPGKKMLSSMTPAIAWEKQDVIAIGSPGGSRIPTATMQVLLKRIVKEKTLNDAVQTPRIHHQWMPDHLFYEPESLTADDIDQLRQMGHDLKTSGRHIGEVNAVEFIDGNFSASADKRVSDSKASVVFR